MPIYRSTIVLALCVLGTGICIKQFRFYRVNYVYIFELDPAFRIREAHLFRLFFVILSAWLFCLLGQVSTIKNFVPFRVSVFPLLLVSAFFLFIFNPFDVLFRGIRYSVLWSILLGLLAPFSIVRFRHFFMADLLTSLVRPLVDITVFWCYAYNFRSYDNEESNQCSRGTYLAALLMSYIPFHIRFWQCIHMYVVTRKSTHLLNALKYSLSIGTVILSYLSRKFELEQSFLVALYVVATLYAYAWDIYMDWGLLRSHSSRKKLLRTLILYPKAFYYWAMVSNFFLRFSWVLTLLPSTIFSDTLGSWQVLLLLLSLIEAFRRAQWSLIRVENENINNFERYRSIPEIPRLPGTSGLF